MIRDPAAVSVPAFSLFPAAGGHVNPPPYVELRCATAFSFLVGASMPEELVERAQGLGYQRLAITDHDGLYGVVRAHGAAKETDVEIIVGTEIHLQDVGALSLLLYPTDRKSYGRLCRLLSIGRMRSGKGGIQLTLNDVAEHAEGLLAIHVGSPSPLLIQREKSIFDDRLYLAIERRLSPFDRTRIEEAQSISRRFSLPLVATGSVLMHERSRKPLQDILTCIRLGMRIDQAGRRLRANANGYLKSRREMAALFADLPETLWQTIEIADRCTFRLDELHHEFALELLPAGETGMSYLWQLVRRGAAERYPDGIPEAVQQQLDHEMKLIDELRFAGYFLTVWDIVRFARRRDILCQGRGSAANSAVCYVLGITAIDPVRMNLLFERFISAERGEPPDIDVDFEHERREEVMQYVYRKYGRDHAAMVANIITYRGRMAYREVGKVLGLGEDQISHISRLFGYHRAKGLNDDELKEAGLDPSDATVKRVVQWAEALRGFPRHLGLHSGGFVITKDPIIELAPVENATMENRSVIAWDKRDVERLGLVKIDLLALGMLTCVHRSFDFIEATEGKKLTLATVPAEDPKTYDMICDADTVGTFQIESRAQMQMLPRLKPRTFYDLVVSVAIVRPGPIQGNMVHPYLRRRDGIETIDYPHPALKAILGRTHGVPLFQEQVMKMAVAVAGFTPGEADDLRRAIGWQSQVRIDSLRERLISGMEQNGLGANFAERIFRMIQGFGGYGFPESHAASFALIGYASAYLKRHHPAAFLAALLNSQPMGFYETRTLVHDAQRHGVVVRPPCVAQSEWDATLEEGDRPSTERWWMSERHEKVKKHSPWADFVNSQDSFGLAVQPTVRLGFRELTGMSEVQAEALVAARKEQAFSSIADLTMRSDLPRDIAARLAAAGAFSCFSVSRREALWKVMALDRKSTLFRGVELPDEGTELPEMTEQEEMRADYGTTRISVNVHPVQLMRDLLKSRGVLGYAGVEKAAHGQRVRVGGMVVTRQRPATASGVVFITLEDEDGHVNLVVFAHIYDRFIRVARDATMLIAEGTIQRTDKVINVIVDHFAPLDIPGPGVEVGRNFF